MLARALILALVTTAFTLHARAADPISGDYRIDNQHAVFITKISDKPNTYYATVFLVGQKNQSCYFGQEMKLASGGLVYASLGCQIGISKDSANTVKVVGSCPQYCKDGMSISSSGFVKEADVEALTTEELYKGD
jgi:hypothetical protein